MKIVVVSKKPVQVQAALFNGSPESLAMILHHWGHDGMITYDFDHETGEVVNLYIHTLEGRMIANPGDWIIQGVSGELYPCKPDIFEQTYQYVSTLKEF